MDLDELLLQKESPLKNSKVSVAKHDGEEKENENSEDEPDYTPIYIKIWYNYIQIISVVGTFEFSWPDEAYSMFGINKTLVSSSQQFFSFDCLLKQEAFKRMGLRVFFTKLWLLSLSPLAAVAFVFILWKAIFFFRYKSERRRYHKQFYYNFLTSVVIILFMIHPNILDCSLSSFSYYFIILPTIY